MGAGPPQTLFLFLILILAAENEICQDAENEGSSDGSDGDFSKVEGETADAGNEDGGDDEEVTNCRPSRPAGAF